MEGPTDINTALNFAKQVNPELQFNPCRLVHQACLIYRGLNLVKLDKSCPKIKQTKRQTLNPPKIPKNQRKHK